MGTMFLFRPLYRGDIVFEGNWVKRMARRGKDERLPRQWVYQQRGGLSSAKSRGKL